MECYSSSGAAATRLLYVVRKSLGGAGLFYTFKRQNLSVAYKMEKKDPTFFRKESEIQNRVNERG